MAADTSRAAGGMATARRAFRHGMRCFALSLAAACSSATGAGDEQPAVFVAGEFWESATFGAGGEAEVTLSASAGGPYYGSAEAFVAKYAQ